ncbi:MAG: ABC transporter substrate-binding protein [Bacteroidia bacterium]|nr:MAG: ABC transporter substrate-binding protein [Bacteroidia bacterium]
MKAGILILLVFIISLLMVDKNIVTNHFKNKTNTNNESLLIYVGAASKPPTEEIIEMFQKETSIKVNAIYGGSGFVLSQMKLSQKGDIYFPGSSDYMELAKREKLVFPETEKKVVYLVNAINVQKGNPKNIQSLKDLCKPGIKVAIANPEGVCVGAYAIEIIEKNLSKNEIEQLKKNIVNYTESCDKTAAVVALKSVDAVIGWSVFQYWNPDAIESVPLKKNEIVRIAYIPIAIATFTKNKQLAQKFIDYIVSEKGKSVFKKHHYFVSVKDAENYIGATKPVGGEYAVPANWIKNK